MNPREKNFLFTALVVAAAFVGLGLVQAKGPDAAKLASSPAQNHNPFFSGNGVSWEMCVISSDSGREGELSKQLLRYVDTGRASAPCEALYDQLGM